MIPTKRGSRTSSRSGNRVGPNPRRQLPRNSSIIHNKSRQPAPEEASDYDCWTVRENLSDSRLQEKLLKVQEPNFKGVRDDIAELKKFILEDVLEEAPESA